MCVCACVCVCVCVCVRVRVRVCVCIIDSVISNQALEYGSRVYLGIYVDKLKAEECSCRLSVCAVF